MSSIPDGYEIRRATAADVTALGKLYAAAFEANQAYRYVFTGTPTTPAPPGALQWLFERRVRLLLLRECPLLVLCQTSPPCSVVAAAALIPRARKPGMMHMVRVGILSWPLYWGMPSLKRALSMGSELTQAAESPTGPLAGLAVGGELVLMAVQPDWQGQGLGLHLLTGALAVWDADFGGGGGLLLETQLESAVSMYTKAGFQVCGQQTQHPAGQFTNYIMHRPTPSAAALE
ncbi:hypothetical protein D9Q98_001587 [Chlorella vulgaris]|uniref:N-acetyltransferase domain-containing protein n=1 Tax=Chlorella vulgaris TaxID=3077 RepID=A0A9D4TUL7_CHLVU|nr:hypothetical protein D9Q98_001587 [Chlorella vulgaris]